VFFVEVVLIFVKTTITLKESQHNNIILIYK